jgi:serine/threonine-protein kinase
VASYRKAIELQPDYVQAHINLGATLGAKGDLDGAVAAFRRAIELQPDLVEAHINLGKALAGKGDLDGAGAAYRRAIALRPDYALAYYNLGGVLREQGRFVDCLAAYRRGHELGSKQPGWRYPSAQRVRDAERLVELDSKLAAFQKGEYRPKDNAERLGLAEVCRPKQWHVAAAGLYADAFAAEPKRADDLSGQWRYNAACCAALAAAGRGPDAGPLDGPGRGRWRQQALEWLRADLAAYARQLGGGRVPDRAVVVQRLRHWQGDPDLAGLRDQAALAALPAGEQQDWKKLWAEVAALLRRARGALQENAVEKPRSLSFYRVSFQLPLWQASLRLPTADHRQDVRRLAVRPALVVLPEGYLDP